MLPYGRLTFDGPAVYRIRVQGRIRPSWADRLEGMAIEVVERADGPPVTALEGELLDQASLTGVLNTVYELHLPVLSVECLGGLEPDQNP
jgi:hypothetical protein